MSADGTGALTGSAPPDVVIVTPVLDDWACVGALLDRLDAALGAAALRAHVLVVDDGSAVPAPGSLGAGPFRALERVELLELRVNLGHQRAIAVGLVHLESSGVSTPVAVMDADGEDRPEDLPRLLARARAEPGVAVVFARREKRSEGLRFRALYTVYRWAHRALCGIDFRVGNFSCLAAGSLSRIVASPHLWNHYAGALLRSRLPTDSLGVDRGQRISGRSRMNLPALVAHGLSSFAVHADIVGARLVIFSALVTSGDTSNPAIEGRVKTGQRMAASGTR